MPQGAVSAGRRRGKGRAATVAAAALVPLTGAGALAGVVATSLGAGGPDAGAAANVTPPNLQILVPVDHISIGTNPATGHRQLQFTHITWDAGPGPFRLEPTYHSATGLSTFTQTIYNMPSPGVWRVDHTVPLAVDGTFDPPSDYRYPLTRFTLDRVNPDGSPGPVVATSPKTDYCITADTFVGGVPNTPPSTSPPQSNCTHRSAALGFSVGWGDQYDQTDNGQPIDLTGVPDGSYILHAIVDPQHIFTETDPSDDVVDTKLVISGNSVAVRSQTSPKTTPPTVAVTAPAPGATVSGTVTLQASAAATSPATVSSVQFLLDGQPLGPAISSAPYTYQWATGGAGLGTHTISAQVTDSAGNVGTAPPETVSVVKQNDGSLQLDSMASRHATGTVTDAISTYQTGDTLLALVGSDGPAGAGDQTTTVSGGGLTWHLVQRVNQQSGDAEIWTANSPGLLSSAKITSRPLHAGFDQQLTVLAYMNSGGVGASSGSSAPGGAPSVGLTTTASGSFTLATGFDWDHALARTYAADQTKVQEWDDTTSGNTFWSQRSSAPGTSTGQSVTLADTGPTTDEWDMAGAEVIPAPPADPPSAAIVNPAANQVVSGTVPLAATAQSTTTVRSVQFLVDGQPAGPPVTSPPFGSSWNTTTVRNGVHELRARATNAAGKTGTSPPVAVSVQNPAPPMTCFVIDKDVAAAGSGTVEAPAFHTAAKNERLVAFVTSGGPDGGSGQTVRVAGAGLQWERVARSAGRGGDAEVWTAVAHRVLTGAKIRSVASVGGYQQHLSVIAIEGTAGVGATRTASGHGTPHASLTTTHAPSLVFAVGRWRSPAAPIYPFGWVGTDASSQGPSASAIEYTNQPPSTGTTTVHPAFGVPGPVRWSMVAVELVGDGS